MTDSWCDFESHTFFESSYTYISVKVYVIVCFFYTLGSPLRHFLFFGYLLEAGGGVFV